jgi:hypothetical protein
MIPPRRGPRRSQMVLGCFRGREFDGGDDGDFMVET